MIDGRAWRAMRMAVQASGFLVLSAQVALPAMAQDPSVRVITTTITSAGAHKECVSLSKAQNLRYWYRADSPIDFTIQYQEGSGLAIPVRRDKLSRSTGTYRARAAEVHCMVLTNRAQKPVTVRLEFARVER